LNNEPKTPSTTFSRRLDFYWQFIAVYAIAIILYALVKGTIDEWRVTVVLLDPVVILLCIFILATLFGLLESMYTKHQLILTKDFIILKSRFKERKYTIKEIVKITIGRENLRHKGVHRIIKLKVNTRKRFYRIRTQSYLNDKELLMAFVTLKKNLNK
jgi:hypothetical protein